MIEFSRKRVHEGVSLADGRVYTDRCRGKIRSTGGEKKNSQLNTSGGDALKGNTRSHPEHDG